MAEAEFGGVKFKGGKIFVLLTALSTLGGVAWGGFEFYNDYRNMKTKINKYVAPDLSGLQEQLSVLNQKMIGVEERVIEGTDSNYAIEADIMDAAMKFNAKDEGMFSPKQANAILDTFVDPKLKALGYLAKSFLLLNCCLFIKIDTIVFLHSFIDLVINDM